jgi:hypothetical protein
VDRSTFIGSLLGAAGFVAGVKGTDARRRRLCGGCGGRKRCTRANRCVQGRCVPKTVELVCGGAYQACKNGRLPACQNGVATCSGNKPATPYCG